ncbi:hypothetical protein, partial [Sinorhizobium psoraleae]|uniref:hypothetical protein n=1 Tax=Sinorhizobium psoraleae TaxID=520838 RepID=UPI001AED3F3B
ARPASKYSLSNGAETALTNRAAHPGIRSLDLAPITDLAGSTGLGNGDSIVTLRNIDSDKIFSIIRHGSSSCYEDRPGLSEQPSEEQLRASHLTPEEGHTVSP